MSIWKRLFGPREPSDVRIEALQEIIADLRADKKRLQHKVLELERGIGYARHSHVLGASSSNLQVIEAAKKTVEKFGSRRGSDFKCIVELSEALQEIETKAVGHIELEKE